MNVLLVLDEAIPEALQKGLAQRLEAPSFAFPLNAEQQSALAKATYIFVASTQLDKGVPPALYDLPKGDYAFGFLAIQAEGAFPPAFDALSYWALKRQVDSICQEQLRLANWPEQLPQLIRRIKQQQKRYTAPFPRLELSRSVLRKPQLADAPDFLRLHSDPAINRYVPRAPLPNLAQAERILQESWQDYQLQKGITWLAEDSQRESLIGGIGFTNWLPQQRSAEFGGRLFPRYWGSHRALQASERVIEFGFEEMGLHRIEAQMLSQNRSAIRLAEMLGFEQEGILQDKVLDQQEFYDVEIWSLFCKE